MLSNEDVKPLQISLQEISLATNGFSHKNLIGHGGYGRVYKGMSEKHGPIAVKLWDSKHGQGDCEFKREIALLSKCKHENIVSLCGFCDEDGEKILVYKYESNGSLDKHLDSEDLKWIQRLLICLDAAQGLKYLHDVVGHQHRVIHRDVKSANILLDEKWNAKISDFGLSREGPANTQSSFVFTNPCGTPGYIDPEYHYTGYLTQKSDVYSFGVVLWEVLCGKLAIDRQFITVLVQKNYKRKTLDSIIPSYIHKQINKASLLTFSEIAYRCLMNSEERPTMKQVVEQLQEALDHQFQTVRSHKELKKPQEVVLSVFVHCEGCADKIRNCLKGFEGVEKVHIDLENSMVVVKGKNVDPSKIRERVQKKIRRDVDLILPVPKPLAKDCKKLEQEKPPKQEAKKEQPTLVTTVVLEVHMDCEACAREMSKHIRTMKGVESVVPDIKTSQVTVTGTFLATELTDHVYKKKGKKAVIVKQHLYPRTEKAKTSSKQQGSNATSDFRDKSLKWAFWNVFG